MVTTASIAAVALGGALGATARHLTGAAMLRALGPGFPWGTLTVNVLGCLAMGVVAAILMGRGGESFARWSPLLMTGVLGGFTTFSAFSLDALTLVERGETLKAAAYVLGSVVLSVGALAAGLALGRSV